MNNLPFDFDSYPVGMNKIFLPGQRRAMAGIAEENRAHFPALIRHPKHRQHAIGLPVGIVPESRQLARDDDPALPALPSA